MVTLAEPTTADLTLENLLDTDIGRRLMSCIQCGVCVGTCPYGDVMVHTPRRLIEKIKKGFFDEVLGHDDMLNCVTCYACWSKCPRGIALTDVVLPLVKEQVLLNLPEMPAELQSAFESTLRYGNPLGESPRRRAAWTAETDLEIPVMKEVQRPVEVLWVVECYASYYPRGQENARATAKILNALGIDYAILGSEEKCAGECARLAGETGLFDTLREQNIATFEKYEFESIVTSDPHAFDAFAFLYPFLGFQKPVSHTTPFVASRLEELKPLLTRDLGYKVTYHDTCVLGRHNEMFTQPRAILAALPGIDLIEMPHNRENTICCGGGGGGMWLDTFYATKGHDRLSDRRVREAIATGADVLAVSCPYEVPRFEDSLKVLGADDRMVVRDVMELAAEAIGD